MRCLACILILLLVGCDTPVVSLQQPKISIVREREGVGREVATGDVVTIDYRVKLPDGKQIMQADDYPFVVGQGAVVEGVDDAVQGMRSGGRRVIECPPHKHWGRKGTIDGTIPPNTTLTIDIRLLSVE